MSKSRSPTPTTNTNPSLQSTSLPTTSRPQIHETPPIVPHVGEREEQSTVTVESRPQPSSSTTPVPQPAERRPHPTSSPPATMAKRLRKSTPSPPLKRPSRSSPSSDSQGGMADTEDGTRSQHSEKERSPTPTAAPKKKRTRTLTTPHQSAVLHALLAQSRFPTTAMREEVGRSIGLSARKVQIWFQNQRQKARRPRTSEDTSRVFGAFPQPTPEPSGQSTVTLEPRPFLLERPATYHGPSSSSEDPRYVTPLSAHPSEGSYPSSGSMESASRLLGPGMPGADLRAQASFARQYSPPDSPVAGPSSSRPLYEPYPLRPSHSPPRHLRLSRPISSSHTIGDIIDRDSRTLPPLIFPPRAPAGGLGGAIPPSQRSAPASMAPFVYPRSPSPRFAHHVPESSLPPPFTLQPPPQWDRSHFTTMPSSAHSSSWSSRPGTRSAQEGSASPTSPHLYSHTIHEEIEPDDTLESSQAAAARYDPVRASMGHHHHAGSSSFSQRRPAPSSRADKDYPHSA